MADASHLLPLRPLSTLKIKSGGPLKGNQACTSHASWRKMAEDQKSIDDVAKTMLQKRMSILGQTCRAANVKRWDGMQRRTTDWDNLRRDPELWFPEGNCLVHLYGRGQSRRGPSFRVPCSLLQASRCEPMLDRYSSPDFPDASRDDDSSSDGGFTNNPSRAGKLELFIPAPRNLSREDAFRFHLTTRNFFAWMVGKPLVGPHLGGALVDLLERMKWFRPVDSLNVKDIVEYLDQLTFSDFRECPNHALAVLYFAEHCQVVHLWRDAFVHCAGMNDRLLFSPEFEPISKTTKALITRAKLEMDLRMDHAGRSLGNFLEEELSSGHLGLPQPAQAHLDRFRSFLHSYYVRKNGYWPPAQLAKNTQTLSKSTYRSMYFEFRSLYQFLVDMESTHSTQDDKDLDSVLSVRQNINVFDRRHHYTTLPHPLPRIPATGQTSGVSRRSHGAFDAMRMFGLGKAAKAEKIQVSLAALSAATNVDCDAVKESALVQEYIAFERECVFKEEEKLSQADGRKVRWLLIYGVLQTLISVTRAPKEVRDTEGVSYSLCIQLAGTPPWQQHPGKKGMDLALAPWNQIPVQEERETDMFGFALKSPTTTGVSPSTTTAAGPLLMHAPRPTRPVFSEILVAGYGNGTSPASLSASADPLDTTTTDQAPSTPGSVSARDSHASALSSSAASDGEAGWPDMDHPSVTSSWYGDEDDECIPKALVIRPASPSPIPISTTVPQPMSREEVAELDELLLVNRELQKYVFA